MFLTVAELIELTGRKRRSDQAAWLKKHGYRFEVNARQQVKVTRAHVEAKLGGTKQTRAQEPNFTPWQQPA